MCRLLRLGRGTTAHESCTPKLDGKFSGLSYESRVPWPPTTSTPLHCHPLYFQAAPQFPFRPFPVTKTIHIALVYYPSRLCAYTFDISRKREHGCSQSIGFKAPKPCPAVTGESSRGWFQEIEKSWGVSSVIAAPREPFVPCFRQKFVDKTVPRSQPALCQPASLAGCDSSNLPIPFFRQEAPISIAYGAPAVVQR